MTTILLAIAVSLLIMLAGAVMVLLFLDLRCLLTHRRFWRQKNTLWRCNRCSRSWTSGWMR